MEKNLNDEQRLFKLQSDEEKELKVMSVKRCLNCKIKKVHRDRLDYEVWNCPFPYPNGKSLRIVMCPYVYIGIQKEAKKQDDTMD